MSLGLGLSVVFGAHECRSAEKIQVRDRSPRQSDRINKSDLSFQQQHLPHSMMFQTRNCQGAVSLPGHTLCWEGCLWE